MSYMQELVAARSAILAAGDGCDVNDPTMPERPAIEFTGRIKNGNGSVRAVNKQDPGVKAGATEAKCFAEPFTSKEFRKRAEAATAVAHAIADCDREDAVVNLPRKSGGAT